MTDLQPADLHHPLLLRAMDGLADRLTVLRRRPSTLALAPLLPQASWAGPALGELLVARLAAQGLRGLRLGDGIEPVDLGILLLQGGASEHRAALNWAKARLAPDGVVAVACLGAASLPTLQQSLGPRAAEWVDACLIDLHDLGDLMVGSGLRAPVMESQGLALTYSSPGRAAQDLSWLGPRWAEGLAGLPPAGPMAEQTAAIAAVARTTVSLELVFGHAFGAQAAGLDVPSPRGRGAAPPVSVVRFQPAGRKDTDPGIDF